MKLDIDFFRPAKKDFIESLRRNEISKWDELNGAISLYCSCTGLPILVAIIFVEEEFSEYKEELEKKRTVVVEFYGYD